jgi:FtsP/CotA-like multicopper oxidase with cupredoxin domain
MCLSIALITSGSPLAAERDGNRDDGGGRKCRSAISEAGDDPSGFPQPHVRRSHNGVLRTTLHACIATNTIVDQPTGQTRQINTTTFEGTIPGPTLSVEPSDRLSLMILNDLPANPPGEREKAFPHDEYELNIHTHGLIVSPLGNSDNIFRHMDPVRRIRSKSTSPRITRPGPSGITRTCTER